MKEFVIIFFSGQLMLTDFILLGCIHKEVILSFKYSLKVQFHRMSKYCQFIFLSSLFLGHGEV